MRQFLVLVVFVGLFSQQIFAGGGAQAGGRSDAVGYDNVKHLAAYGHWDKLLELLRSGNYKNLDETESIVGNQLSRYFTALMCAAQDGKFDVVQALVERGANVNLRATGGDNRGKTAADLAYDRGYIQIVNYLKEHGTIDFNPIQSAAPQPAPQTGGGSAQPSERVFVVTVWYTSSGTRLSSIYSVQATSKDMAEREAERQWKTQFGWNQAMQFQEAVANF